MKICVLGLGYIGLPTAALFATYGHKVVGIDINKNIVETVNKGITPFDEPGLPELLENAISSKNLIAKTEVEEADVFIIALPTPLDKEMKIAELKYINIALANEFAQISEECRVNVWEAIELANKHPRVNVLKPGPGVGGHCIAIDPWFLTENSTRCRIVSLAREINDGMPNHVLQIVKGLVKGVDDPIITVFGVAYKGDVDDTRETPATGIVEELKEFGVEAYGYDPLLGREEIGGFGVRAFEDVKMDGVIVAVAHEYLGGGGGGCEGDV